MGIVEVGAAVVVLLVTGWKVGAKEAGKAMEVREESSADTVVEDGLLLSGDSSVDKSRPLFLLALAASSYGLG